MVSITNTLNKTTMEIKYTTDGKKVVVIGNLNAQEKIVQEIFIVNDIEVPSGENFVVKSLHDAPAVSWKETEIKKLDATYERDRKAHEKRMDELNKGLRRTREELSAKLNYVASALKNVSEDSFNLIADYLCGNIKYIVIEGYKAEIIDIDKFKQTESYDGYWSKANLRLISIYGDDDGTLTFKQGQYSDDSGNYKCTFHPFKDYDAALEKFKEVLISKSISDVTIVQANEYGIALDADKLEAYKENKRQSYIRSIESANKTLESYKKALCELDVTLSEGSEE